MDAALRLRPDDPDTLNVRGFVLSSTGRFNEALGVLEHVLYLDPDHTDAKTNKRIILEHVGDIAP